MKILFEDNHLVAIDKKAGILTHSDKTGDKCATEQTKLYIKEKFSKPGAVFLTPVHRLDRPVSGLLLFARTSKATSRMTVAFKARETVKTYLAITNRKPKEPYGQLEHSLLKNSRTNTVSVVKNSTPKAKKAILDYELIQSINGYYLIKVTPLTGRSHQIRVQLSAMGCPIVGDLKYGSKEKTDGRSICLHSHKLSFTHPVKKEPIEITCEIPKTHFWRFFT